MINFFEITAQELYTHPHQEQFTLIDVREIFEYQVSHIENSINIPLSSLLTDIKKYQLKKQVIMICRAGIRSRHACELLLTADSHNVKNNNYQLYNLTDGMVGWQRFSTI